MSTKTDPPWVGFVLHFLYTVTMRMLLACVMCVFGLLWLSGAFDHATAGQPASVLASQATTPSFAIAPAALPEISAASFVVFDPETGAVLLEQAADTKRAIASITKLMTAAAVLESTTAEAVVTITPADTRSPGVVGAVKLGEEYTAYQLLFPLLLTSSNHVSDALLRTDAELVARMNQLAGAWGLTQTAFADASGLLPDNYSTARELALMTTKLRAEAPHVFDISRLSQYGGPYTGWRNNNPFAGEAGYIGGKHGYTEVAGRTVVALFTETLSGTSRELGYVLLGSADLIADMAQLRAYTSSQVSYR